LRGEYTAAHGTTSVRPAPAEPAGADPRLVYLPAASHCYAIVQYDAASARLVRRVVGLLGDADCAEQYARDGAYHLYDIAPATAVIPRME
jgi:hypothetical protein